MRLEGRAAGRAFTVALGEGKVEEQHPSVVTLRSEGHAAGLRRPAVTDLRTGEKLTVSGGAWPVPVRGKSFRMLDVGG